MRAFVDVHTHAVPSGDDGARSTDEAVALCRLALEGGTRVLFATPHAHAEWDAYPRTPARERLFERSFAAARPECAALGLELRRGWEVFPTVLRDLDPAEVVLEGTRAVLVEFPGHWLRLDDDSVLVVEAVERVAGASLVPVVAHPERSLGLPADFAVARTLVELGSLLCPNGDSFLGVNGPQAEQLAWRLVDEGLVALVASDGHRASRPPRLDAAYHVLAARYGAPAAGRLVDGSALPWTRPPLPGTGGPAAALE